MPNNEYRRTVSTTVDDALLARLKEVCRIDRRVISHVIRICIEEQLPEIERRIAASRQKKK